MESKRLTKKITILTPVYNDWESFFLLSQDIKKCLQDKDKYKFNIIAINDGSVQTPNDYDWQKLGIDIEILHLARNVGHQKAIALGLAFINDNRQTDFIVVMDSDGEDMPCDILNLAHESIANPNKIIFAHRIKRKEKPWFVLFYQIYKFIFELSTGTKITFGNFSLVPYSLLKRLVNVSEIWNHYSAGVLFSRLPFKTIPIERGTRLAGQSKMNFTGLILHGLAAISVQANVVSVRILLCSLVFIGLSILGILVGVGVKLTTTLAIPGWLTSVVIGLGIIMIQAIMISIFLVFIVLNNRIQRQFIPSIDYKIYIASTEILCSTNA